MKASRIREQTDEELRTLHDELTRELLELKVKGAIGEGGENPMRRRLVRRDLARLKTVMTERGNQIHG